VNTIAIASGKGGVGKSFLALNLAWALAELGQRVLLIELDADAGALSIAAGLGEPKVQAPASDAAQIVKRIHAVPGNSRIQLLRAADIPTQAARSPAALTPLLQGAQAHWRIVDLPPGLGSQSVLWMRGGAPSMLIGVPELVCVQAMLRLHLQLRRQHAFEWLCANEPRLRTARPSLSDARQRLVEQLGPEQAEQRWQSAFRSYRSCRWIFNRVLPDDDAQLARITAYLRVHAGGEAAQPRLIPEDAAQLACARVGRPLMNAHPDSAAAQSIRSIANELMAQHLPTLRAAG
jgi:MinD-like ATPase involved in chromosome partitioning or flagellar assembly